MKHTSGTQARRMVTMFLLLASTIVVSLPAFAKVPIVMWLSSQPPDVPAWAQTFQDQFNAKNPDIDLKIEVYPSVTPLREKLIVAVAGGVAPDIMYDGSNTMGQWIISEIAKPIDKYLNAMPDRKDLMPDIIRGVQYAGKTWALPFSVWPVGDLYNMSLFNAHGIALPRSWDELISAARRLLQLDDSGKIKVFGYRMSANDVTNFINLQLAMEQTGGTAIEPEGSKATLTTSSARQALTFIHDVMEAGMPASNGASGVQQILDGTVAVQHMFLSYTMVQMADQIASSGIELKFRRYVGPQVGKDLVQHNAGDLFMVSTTKNPDQAWKVMQTFIERDNLKKYLMAHGSALSIRMSQASDYDLRSRPYVPEMMAALTPPISSYGPTNPFFTDFRGPAGAFITKAIKNQMAMETALQQAEETVNQIVADKLAQLKR